MSIRVPVHIEECPVRAAISEDPHRDVSAWDGLCWGRLGSRVGLEVGGTSRPPAQDHLCMAINGSPIELDRIIIFKLDNWRPNDYAGVGGADSYAVTLLCYKLDWCCDR
jgi:hypothetical protein